MSAVLIVDDSELILQMLQMVCEQAGFTTVTATNISDAHAALRAHPIEVVVTDLNMPDSDDPVAEIQSACDLPIIVVSGQPQADLDQIAAEKGAAGAVSKDSGMMGMAQVLPELLRNLVT